MYMLTRKIPKKKEIYYDLIGVYQKIPKYDIKISIVDCNAKVGKENIYKHINGQKLKEFCIENKENVMST